MPWVKPPRFLLVRLHLCRAFLLFPSESPVIRSIEFRRWAHALRHTLRLQVHLPSGFANRTCSVEVTRLSGRSGC
jgi:hypothetical protein